MSDSKWITIVGMLIGALCRGRKQHGTPQDALQTLAPVLVKEENPPHSQTETPLTDQHNVKMGRNVSCYFSGKSLSKASKIGLDFFPKRSKSGLHLKAKLSCVKNTFLQFVTDTGGFIFKNVLSNPFLNALYRWSHPLLSSDQEAESELLSLLCHKA